MDILPQIDNQRFAIVKHCHDCEYTSYDFVAAKAVVADYYGVVDGKAHTYTATMEIDSVDRVHDNDRMEGTVSRDLSGWEENKAPAWNPYPADETTGETTAPRCESTLFLYSRGNQASLENFTVARVRVLEGAAEYILMEDGEIRDLTHYGAFFGETAAEGSDRVLPITLRGKHARTVDLEITLRSEKGDFTLTVPVTLTQADTQVTAAFTTLSGQSLGEPQTLTYGEIPVLPLLSAETLEAMQADLPADNIYLDLTTPQGWSPSAAEPVYADTVYLPGYQLAGFTVEFYDTGDPVKSEFIVPGQSALCPKAPEKDGYRFVAWTDGVQLYAPGASITPTRDMRLSALWRKSVAIQVWVNAYSSYVIYEQDRFTDYNGQAAVIRFESRAYIAETSFQLYVDDRRIYDIQVAMDNSVWPRIYEITIPADAFPADTTFEN